VKCEENEKQAEEDALKTILEENECRRKRTFIPAENTQFRVGGHKDERIDSGASWSAQFQTTSTYQKFFNTDALRWSALGRVDGQRQVFGAKQV